MTTLAAAFPRLGSRGDRSTVGPDLGVEPPIRLGEDRLGRNERRTASLRWLAGAALAGLCGMTLIGAALYLDFDSQYDFAEAPEFAAPARLADSQEGGVNPSKGDRLLRPVDIVSDKQTFKAPTIIKVGDKEVVKVRPFTRLETTLTMTPTGFADAVPPFNPLKITNGGTDVAAAPPPDPGPVQDDAEVSFRVQDLSPSDAEQISGELTQAEAEAQVVETLKAPADPQKAASQSLPPQLLLMRTSRAGEALRELSAYATEGSVSPSTPFGSIEVRMIPENVSNVVKASPDDASPSEKLVQMRNGESFEDVLKANGASPEAVQAILAAFGVRHGESPVGEGQKIIILPEEPAVRGEKAGIARISVYADDQLKATVAAADDGSYKPVALHTAQAPRKPRAEAGEESSAGGMSLYESLYETALKQGLPRPVIDLMTRVFANDVDFQRATAPGDSIEAFYSDPDDVNPRPELLCASMTVRDQTFKYYRFQTPDDNKVDFYDENGRSMRKFLIRKPVADGEMTSPFGMRYHPILHYARMHTGVDWAAPIGTPIYAAGNGVIIMADWDGGYGRRVEIQHANGYVTTYNHMSAFGRGIVAGAHVVQGQTVGYIGDTGLATGPHLHYEVIINGNFVDPMAIRLPRTREFDGKMLAAFKRERDRIDQLMGEAPSAVAMSAEKPALTPAAATAELQPSSTESPPPAPMPNPNAARTLPGLKSVPRSSASDTD